MDKLIKASKATNISENSVLPRGGRLIPDAPNV